MVLKGRVESFERIAGAAFKLLERLAMSCWLAAIQSPMMNTATPVAEHHLAGAPREC
jgi:hypothetical protein